MIERIIEFSARNRALVLLGVAVLCVFAFYTLKQSRLDALPDLSDTQVIVYSRWDRSPDIIEDQVTYPIISALLGAPRVKAIDTTGAGDAFNAGLAMALAEGAPLADAARFASATAALAVTKHGAALAMPRRGEVETLLTTTTKETKR